MSRISERSRAVPFSINGVPIRPRKEITVRDFHVDMRAKTGAPDYWNKIVFMSENVEPLAVDGKEYEVVRHPPAGVVGGLIVRRYYFRATFDHSMYNKTAYVIVASPLGKPQVHSVSRDKEQNDEEQNDED